jgi:hypothetical protein
VYASTNIVQVMKLMGHVACMQEKQSVTGLWWGKRLRVRPRHKWEDNIKMDLIEIE